MFPLFGGLHFWFPKMTGRLLNETGGKAGFWLMFTGFNVVFFPQHQLGLYGMPRRVYSYQAGLGWENLNLISSIGFIFMAAAVLLFLFNAIRRYRSGRIAGDDPWTGESLEWATTSPPPSYNFHYIPVV